MEEIQFWFSPTTCVFYDGDFKETYEANGDWPDDAYEVPFEVVSEFTSESPEGKHLGADSGGNPAWVDYVMDADAQGCYSGIMREEALKGVSEEIHLYNAKAALRELSDSEKEELSKLVMMYEDLKG